MSGPVDLAATGGLRSESRPNWWIYALGGGMGHLCRSLALARRAARRGVAVRVLSNSPFATILAKGSCRQLLRLEPGIEVVAFPSQADKAEIISAIHRTLRELPPPDVLVVDTFPRGLAGELAEILGSFPSFKVLVHRDLNPEYVRWAELESFAARYDLILLPGEDAPFSHLPQAVRTEPWLVCDADELLSAALARESLSVPAQCHLPVCVVIGSGKADEALAAAHAAAGLAAVLAERAVVRFVSCEASALQEAGSLACSCWPLLAALNGVDLLVGAGGYNTVYEARATQTPLIAVAQPRLYDRQAHRLLPHECAMSWDHAVELARQFFEDGEKRRRDTIAVFPAGADDAVQHILTKCAEANDANRR